MAMIDDREKEDALDSGVFILSGGRGVDGNLLLTVPTNKLTDIAEWTPQKLVTLFLHFATISKFLKLPVKSSGADSQALQIALLADLSHATTQTIRQLVETLESVEHQSRGTVSAVYFMKPRHKAKSHLLKKLLGVKPSKKRPRVPLFKVVLMKTLQELHTHVDVSKLTVDFCGTLQYNHANWMHLYAVVIKCIERCQDLLMMLPSVRDKVDLLQEYETDGLSSSQVQQLLVDLLEKYNVIVSESCLPLCLTQSKQSLFLLDHPSSDSRLSSISSELVNGFRLHLRNLYSELDQWNSDLEEAWRVTENRLTVLTQVHRYRERAREIERKICEHYHPLLREHPIVGKTLSQAELYRAHFTTTLYDPAKELLSQATEILEAVHRLKNGIMSLPTAMSTGSGHDSAIGSAGSVISDIDVSDINKCLTTSIQPFTMQLQQLQQIYVNIHIFHLLFEKALTWYKKVLKFIPETLLQRCTTDREYSPRGMASYSHSPQTQECLVYMPTEWLGAVRVFLSRHPPPRQEHIDRLDERIPQLVDRKLRSQARSLALRLRLLQRVLTSSRLPLKLVTAVLAWKAELFGGSQQEKVSGVHQPTSPSKERHKSALHPSHRKSDSDQIELREGARKDGQRFTRSRKSGSFDQESQGKSRAGHVGVVKSASGQGTSDEHMQQDRLQKPASKKYSGKMLLRSKSVEFNVNSSSTDGSVFDYDKALMQAEAGADMVKARAVPRKSRTLMRDGKSLSGREMDRMSKSPWLEEQAFSDPSEMLRNDDKTRDSELKGSHTMWHRDYKTEPSHDEMDYTSQNYNTRLREEPSDSDILPEPEPPLKTSSLKHSRQFLLSQQNTHLSKPRSGSERSIPSPLPSSAVAPQAGERFICLTFTPNQIDTGTKTLFRFSSMENLLQNSEPDNFEEEAESGIDTVDGADPDDSVVQRIREISASNLTNTEKLKKVSELLSNSTTKASTDKRNSPVSVKSAKFSHSTLDLRPAGSHQQEGSNKQSDENPRDLSYHNQKQNARERPVDAVLRMKRNLARSMEDLDTISSHPEPHFNQPYQAEASTIKPVSNHNRHEDVRYVSELKIQPVYMTPKEVTKQITVIKSDGKDRSASDVEISQNKFLPKSEESSRARSWSDVESVSPGASISPSRIDLPSPSPRQPLYQSDYPSVTDFKENESSNIGYTSDVMWNDPVPRTNSLGMLPSDLTTPARPSSLSFSTSRNFISPSFLRPAASMRDLTTTYHPSATLDFLQEIDIEADFQALEDLEMLRTLQEDPLSQEFSRFMAGGERRQQRQKSNDNVAESKSGEMGNSDSLQSSENHSQSVSGKERDLYSSWHKESSSRQESRFIPDIKVSLQGVDHSHIDEDEDNADMAYLQTNDEEFDRLTSEADQECISQQEVADSLRKTQRILEEEEFRRQHGRHHDADMSVEEDEEEDVLHRRPGGLSHTASVDYGYGSWTSKLVSARSTSSEGASTELDKDWRKLSSSSAESAAIRTFRHSRGTIRDMGDNDECDADIVEVDTVGDLPEVEKPLTDPDLY